METDLDNKQIESLIEKYFEGETSSKEEQILFAYFEANDVPEDLQSCQSYFSSLNILKSKQTSLSLSGEKPPYRFTRRYNLSYFVRFAAVAASVALIVVWVQIQAKPNNYVVINGIKYTDKETVEQAFAVSLENAKLNIDDIFND